MKNQPKKQAFSFFKTVLVDVDLPGHETILAHEMVHVKHWHSADILFFELLKIINWFNPVIWAYKKEITDIHEYIADKSLTSDNESRDRYTQLLVANIFDVQPLELSNSFFNEPLIKKRIDMLYKTQSSKTALLKYGLAAPLFAFLVILSASTNASERVFEKIQTSITPNVEVLSHSELEVFGKPKEQKHKALVSKISPIVNKTSEKEGELTDDLSESYQSLISAFHPIKNIILREVPAFHVTKENELNPKWGIAFFKIKINDQQKIASVELFKSTGAEWTQTMLNAIKKFDGTLNLKPRTYIYCDGFTEMQDYRIYDDVINEIYAKYKTRVINAQKPQLPQFEVRDESSSAEKLVNNYIIGPCYKNPTIFVDGKKVSYQQSGRTLKFEHPITSDLSGKNVRLRFSNQELDRRDQDPYGGTILIETKKEGDEWNNTAEHRTKIVLDARKQMGL